MKRGSPAWLKARHGPLSPRRMSAALTRIETQLEREQLLALEHIAERQDPWAVLVGCLISLRTRDEVTFEVAPRVLAEGPTPEALAALDEQRLSQLLKPAGFYRNKARSLRRIAELLVKRGGAVPGRLEDLLGLPGVGRKTANLVLTLGFGKPGICVDTHVHRISNRLGFVRTEAPDDTELVLRERLPRRWWIPINGLLVDFGRNLCTPLSPRCSQCAAARLCLRVGVGRQR